MSGICSEISEGHTLRDACEKQGIGKSTWYDWLSSNPEVSDAYARRPLGDENVQKSHGVIHSPPRNLRQDQSNFCTRTHVGAHLELVEIVDPKKGPPTSERCTVQQPPPRDEQEHDRSRNVQDERRDWRDEFTHGC